MAEEGYFQTDYITEILLPSYSCVSSKFQEKHINIHIYIKYIYIQTSVSLKIIRGVQTWHGSLSVLLKSSVNPTSQELFMATASHVLVRKIMTYFCPMGRHSVIGWKMSAGLRVPIRKHFSRQ